MIRGTVQGFEAKVRLKVRAGGMRYRTVDAVVDTGFDSWMTLPPDSIADLGLRWVSEGRGIKVRQGGAVTIKQMRR